MMFKVGDKVRCIVGDEYCRENDVGVIQKLAVNDTLVLWEDPNDKNDSSWWIQYINIELVEEAEQSSKQEYKYEERWGNW